MKKIIKKGTLLCIVFLTLLVTFFSCSKDKSSSQPDPDPSATPKLFQHKWIFENLIVYPTIAMDPNGPTYFVLGGDGKRFFDFRSNGKIYYMIANSYTDSATYKMQSDSVITMNLYTSGILSNKTDTIVIRTVTENALVFYNRNEGGDYLKYNFKR